MRVILDSVTPQPAGVVIRVRTSVAEQLVVSNPTSTELEVIASTGEPLLSVSARGVFGNGSSPSWYQSLAPYGSSRLPSVSPVNGPATTAWVQVSTLDEWAWFDHRLHPSVMGVGPSLRSAGRGAVLASWKVPMLYGDQSIAVTGHIEFDPIIGDIVPRLKSRAVPPGVQAEVLPGPVPGMFVINRSPSPITILGASGEPFVRLGPAGADINQLSPTWNDNLLVQALPPTSADPASPPKWLKVADEPRFGWIDYRLAYPDSEPPDDVIGRRETVELVRWSIPVQTEGGSIALEGVTQWEPAGRSLCYVQDGPACPPGLSETAARSRIAPLVSLGLIVVLAVVYGAVRRFKKPRALRRD